MDTIYDRLTDLIREHARLWSTRPLTAEEETQVCRWLAQQVKLRWPALSMNDTVYLLEYRTNADNVREPSHQVLPLPEGVTQVEIKPDFVNGGIVNNDTGLRAGGHVMAQYAHDRLFIWHRGERAILPEQPEDEEA